MTDKEKDLLIKDLCCRLPYGVKGNYQNSDDELLRKVTIMCRHLEPNGMVMTGDIKPYLFPLSSMTEKQKKEYRDAIRPATIASIEEMDEDENSFPSLITIAPDVVSVDWCNKNHFDYRGLIPMGLAIDCTNLNIY